MNENRALTLAEVLALEEGRKVWVETSPESHRTTGVYVWYKNLSALIYHEDDDEFILFPPVNMFVAFRVWSLPQPPTPEEMAANPWPVVDDAKD